MSNAIESYDFTDDVYQRCLNISTNSSANCQTLKGDAQIQTSLVGVSKFIESCIEQHAAGTTTFDACFASCQCSAASAAGGGGDEEPAADEEEQTLRVIKRKVVRRVKRNGL